MMLICPNGDCEVMEARPLAEAILGVAAHAHRCPNCGSDLIPEGGADG